MRHEDSWRPQDQITVSVIALGYSVWDLHYNREAESFRLELNGHLQEDKGSNFCYQMPLTTDYDGECTHGSLLTLII